jgi:D-alanyl-lipoteichoic acid acyltransferase DltB (MBOAT superfamily)
MRSTAAAIVAFLAMLAASSRDRNVMVTMLLGGLWHGASANFVIHGDMRGRAPSAGLDAGDREQA